MLASLRAIKSLFVFILAFVITLTISAQISYAANFAKPYSHYSDGEAIESVLTDFARSQGYVSYISSNIKGTISGRFDKVNPKVFIEGMKAAFGVKYYTIGKNIYFYHESEESSTVVKPSAITANKLREMLKSSNLVSDDLPIVIDRNGLLLVKGPALYIDNIVTVSREFDVSSDNNYVMKVFRLKHAKAEDYTIDSFDRSVNIPGVASILSRIVNGTDSRATTMAVTTQGSAMEGLLGQGLNAGNVDTGNSAASATPASQGPSASASASAGATLSPTITADPRLNAVIVQDYQYRIPYYEQVIEELDIPTRLVELHAAVVDVDVDATSSLGVDWRGGRVDGNWGAEAGVGVLQWDGSFPAQATNDGGIFSTIFKTNHSHFMMQVNMLEQNNKARTLGKPSVLTLDNLEATLEDTTTRYVPVQGYQATDLFKVESGTVLRVTPHIIDTHDGTPPLIQMVISLQSNQDNSGSDSLVVDSSGNVQVPPIKQTKINTQAVVRQGQSLLLGGYYVQYAKNGDSGVPGIKDVPAVGTLFGTEGEESFTRERLLLITPRILSLDEMSVPDDIDYAPFDRSPTQASYVNRAHKETEESGCSSNRASKAP